MDQTVRFAIPFLAPGQAQKEWFHNEALQRVDMLLCPVVEGAALASPPSNPNTGSCYLIATGATGAWSGEDGALACFTDAGWKVVAPVEGMCVRDRLSGHIIARREGVWEIGVARVQEVRINGQTVVRERQPAIANPSGGTVIDAECRTSVSNILAMLRTHGLLG